jgi:hypothetical protein
MIRSTGRAGATASPAGQSTAAVRTLGLPLLHVHLFRYAGEDSFSANNLYRCRCGVVRHGL